MTIPLCKDCAFHKPFEYPNYEGCYDECTFNPEINPITGEHRYKFCSSSRGSLGDCGRKGKNFQPKPQNPLTVPEKKVSFWSKLFNKN